MKTNEVLKKAIKDEIDNLIWAAREFAMETKHEDDFQALVKGNEVAILFEDGKDGHYYFFNEESGRLEIEDYNYFDCSCTQEELKDYERVEF